MISKKILQLLAQNPESPITVLYEGTQTLQVSKVEVVEWTDGCKPPSYYTSKEVAWHKKQGNEIGPLRRLRNPQIRLIIPPK